MSLIDRLNKMHRDLYEKSLEEASSYGLFPTRAIEAYSERFHEELPEFGKKVDLHDIRTSLEKSRYILLGDFHTLRQSQREYIRILREIVMNLESPSVVALEMVDESKQEAVDQYMSGNISDDQFLQDIDYERRWGFPWKNYKMIFDFAKLRGLKVYAINSEAAGKKSLQQRDQRMSDRLIEIAQKHPDHKVVALIGEFHLSDSHLPKVLTSRQDGLVKKGEVTRILNNVDRYYFSHGRNVGNLITDYLSLGQNFFCILNTPPWMKWKSLTMWRENQMSIEDDSFLDQDDVNDFVEFGFDVDFNFQKILENVLSFLRLPEKSNLIDTAYLNLCTDARDLSEMLSGAQMEGVSFEKMAIICQRDGFLVDEKCHIFITNLTLNNLSSIAGQYIRKWHFKHQADQFKPKDSFCQRVLEYACGALARRVMNPSHKTIGIQNFEEYLRSHFRRKLKGFAQEKRIEAKAVVDFHNRIVGPDAAVQEVNFTSLAKIDTTYHNGVSRMIGDVLGSKIYSQMVGGHIHVKYVQDMFTRAFLDSDDASHMVTTLYSDAFRDEKMVINVYSA